MKVTDVWEALEHNDKSEGRGGLRRLGVFFTEAGARGAAVGHGVMGTDGEVRPRRALVTDGGRTVHVLEEPAVAIHDGPTSLLRERALAKITAHLTAQERAALGL